MKPGTRRTIARLERDLEEFRAFCELAEHRVPRISGWSIGEHVDHVLKVDRTIFERIDNPIDKPLAPLSTLGHLVLWTGWIPRGKGKAPDFVLPTPLAPQALREAVDETRHALERTVSASERLADPRRVAKHHIFGGMSAAQWLRFAAVHHRHHAKIMRDVLRADPS